MTTLETGRTPHSSSSIYRTALLRELMIATRSSRMSAALSTARGANRSPSSESSTPMSSLRGAARGGRQSPN